MQEGGHPTYDLEPPPYPEFAQMSGSSTAAENAPHIELQLQPSIPMSMASPQMRLGVTPSAPLVESGFVTIPHVQKQHSPETMYSSQQMLLPAESFTNLNTPALTLQTASRMQQPSAPVLQPPILSVGSQAQAPPGGPSGKHYPMFFSTETGKILMNIDGFYHVVPHPVNDLGLQSDRPLIHVAPVGRTPARSEQEREDVSKQRPPSDYYTCTFVMICVTVLCLDFIVLLFCLAPALYFSTKAKNAKMAADYSHALKYGTKSLAFNTIGGVLHVLYLCGVIAAVCCILLLVVRVQG